MDVFFGYQKLRHVLRVAVPVALGLDMIHSFYYVGCLLQEKKQLDAERRTKTLIHSTVHLFRKVSRGCEKTDYGFWPESVVQKIRTTEVPNLMALKRPSYELIDNEEATHHQKFQPERQFVVFPLREWKKGQKTVLQTDTTAPDRVWNLDKMDPSFDFPEEVYEEVVVGQDEGYSENGNSPFWKNLQSFGKELINLAIPYPLLHPQDFLQALYKALEREIRLHLKNSDGYFAQRGVWLRTFLHLPCFIIERRSALRFRLEIVPKN